MEQGPSPKLTSRGRSHEGSFHVILPPLEKDHRYTSPWKPGTSSISSKESKTLICQYNGFLAQKQFISNEIARISADQDETIEYKTGFVVFVNFYPTFIAFSKGKTSANSVLNRERGVRLP